MGNWLLPTLSEILEAGEVKVTQNYFGQFSNKDEVVTTLRKGKSSPEMLAQQHQQAQKEWSAAIAALEELLLQTLDYSNFNDSQGQGLILCAPAPVFSQTVSVSGLQTGIFIPTTLQSLTLMPFQLPAAKREQPEVSPRKIEEYSLLPIDPLTSEQFCLVFTRNFGCVLVLGEDSHDSPRFQFSFDPQVVHQAWSLLKARLLLTASHRVHSLEALIENLAIPEPNYRLVSTFSRQLLHNVSLYPTKIDTTPSHSQDVESPRTQCPEVELLQAFTHEIRTPLATIRTLTRLLLKKRCHLTPDVIKRLEVIDQECSEQIDRMELIFRAVELETTPNKQEQVPLIPIALEEFFQQSVPRWQKHAQRRNVTLNFIFPEKLPIVFSNPAMLDQVLTGLMEKFSRGLSTGGEIQVQVTTAGHQLKLQLLSQTRNLTQELPKFAVDASEPKVKLIGQLLTFQPETGSLSLNLNVTKNLFQALGGKLIVRQRPQQGEVFTIFLPLCSEKLSMNHYH